MAIIAQHTLVALKWLGNQLQATDKQHHAQYKNNTHNQQTNKQTNKQTN